MYKCENLLIWRGFGTACVEGFYENEALKKKLKLWRPIKLGLELEEIFRKLMIKIPGFDVKESIPTDL